MVALVASERSPGWTGERGGVVIIFLEFRWSTLLLGLGLGVWGFALLAITSWFSPRARTRGRRTHWMLGWLVNGLGMISIGASWLLLALLQPNWFSPLLLGLGIPVGVAGVLLFCLCARKVGRLKTPSRYSLELDTTGAYAIVRHPQALAMNLMVGSLALSTGSASLLLSLPLWAVCWFSYTSFEEALELLPVFGEQYRDYRKTTPRLWPRPSGFRTCFVLSFRQGKASSISGASLAESRLR